MPLRLKIVLVVLSCLWSTISCAGDNYAAHPAAIELVDELVQEEGFDRETLLQLFASAQRQESIGLPAVLLVPAPLRWLLSRFLRRSVPGLKVIANSEVPENRTIRVTGVVGTGG